MNTPYQWAIWASLPGLFVVEGMPFRKHVLMQNAGHEYACGLAPEENDVLADLSATKARADMIAGAARSAIVCKLLAAGLQFVKVADGLSFTPCPERVGANTQQIGLGKAG
jgi:hypothetical protein